MGCVCWWNFYETGDLLGKVRQLGWVPEASVCPVKNASPFPVPWGILVALILAALRGKKRSFREDSRACIHLLGKRLQVLGLEHIPPNGACVLTINHYTRPGFGAWWIALIASAYLPVEVHWTVAEAWTFPDQLRSQLFTPLTHWAFRRLAGVYGFTSMPPMPPRPEETRLRAQAVRQVLAYVRRTPGAVIGLAPEGRDIPGAVLGQPPSGAGRFILHLAEQGLDILPVGLFEQGERVFLHYGAAYSLELPPDLAPDERDRHVSNSVMARIARLLPEQFRGMFAGNSSQM